MRKTIFLFIIALLVPLANYAADNFVSFAKGDLQLIKNGEVTIYLSHDDQRGVSIAANNLCNDIRSVTGAKVRLTNNATEATIVIGTAGTVKAFSAYAKQLKGKTEMYLLDIKDTQLFIAGSDRRGTIYGIYELSRQIGVSPWYWWADAPVEKHAQLFLTKGTYTDGEPAVRYRGLFLNDEAPCLTTWVKNTFGTEYGGHEFYAKVFELILRLKGNYLWPAMWGWAFYADDPLNSSTADEMGVIMGTSHHEPMARNHQEYARKRSEWGPWDYVTNKENIDRFFREGMERSKNNEDLITIGMRGDGDTAMGGKEGHDDEYVDNDKANIKLLETICKNQRQIIKEVTGKAPEKRQQVWALYKEVQRYYDMGMKVPDDAIVLLADDNWGDVRRLPSEQELKNHKGGFGMYYHVDYVGAPRNSKWLNVTQTQQMHEQLSLTYDYGVDKLWVLNVGDLKPMEYPIQLFMDMAWKPKEFTTPTVKDHTVRFFEENIGKEYAQQVAEVYNTNSKYAARVTAEMLDRHTYNLETGEWRQVRDDYARLEREALRIYQKLPASTHDFYRQLVLFPVQAMANIYDMYYAQAMNHHLAPLGNPEAERWAQEVRNCYVRDSLLCLEYNKDIAHGKWDGMMIQKHIGYTQWNDNFVQRVPRTLATANTKKYLTQSSDKGFVAFDAEHFTACNAPEGTQWTVYPDYGRTNSAVALTPYTKKDVKGASLTYEFMMPEKSASKTDSITVHVITKSTLDFLSVGGFEYGISVDGSVPAVVNMNKTLIDQQPYTYSEFYPAVARRVIEKTVKVPVSALKGNNTHTLTITPHHPAIVFEQIVVDWGGYKRTYLFK